MSILNKRNAVLGWAVWSLSKQAREGEERGPPRGAGRSKKAAVGAVAGAAAVAAVVAPAQAPRSSLRDRRSQRLGVRIRHAEPSDHARVAAVIDDWWGGRPMRDDAPAPLLHALPRHVVRGRGGRRARRAFSAASSRRRTPSRRTATSSASRPRTGRRGLATELYERLFEAARAAGRTSVHCVT